ncbi:MAG: Peptide transporter substrate-binding protein [Dehalococcoidales bacterium]|nr:Peptide transporter substrate-binding protein [Dehalococcoidales bacterium]
MSEPIFVVENLKKHFPVNKSYVVYTKTVGQVKAVDGIDFSINAGETFGLVGESGCGKTTTSMMFLRAYKPTSGSIRFRGDDINRFGREKDRQYHRAVQMMFQDPFSSLSPRLRVGAIVGEPLIVNGVTNRAEVNDRVKEAIAQVGLANGSDNNYPHEFSGGQRQRIALARAIVLRPQLVVLDEPVSGLDVSIRASVMNLLKDIQQALGISYLLIAHNLGTMRYMCHWVGVMYLGKIVELAESEELFTHPLHPYTHALFSAALPSHPDVKREEIILRGEVPSPINVPPGCRFHPRCFRAKGDCSGAEPKLLDVGKGHFVACGQCE